VGLTVMVQGYLGTVYRSLGDYSRAVACYQKNVACLHGALRHESFGLHGLASVLSRSFLVAPLLSAATSRRESLPQRKGYRLPRLSITPIAVSWRIGPWAFGRCT